MLTEVEQRQYDPERWRGGDYAPPASIRRFRTPGTLRRLTGYRADLNKYTAIVFSLSTSFINVPLSCVNLSGRFLLPSNVLVALG